jgi:uncharacterized membrane protein
MVPGTERATGRVVALGALLVLTGIALRGYLPGQHRAAAPDHGNNSAAMVAVIALLGAAIVIITVAIVATLRQPPSPRQTRQYVERRYGGERARLTWRIVLILLAVLLAWLIVVVLLMQASIAVDFGHPPDTTAPTTPAPTTAGQSRPPPPDPQQDAGGLFWYLLTATIVMLVVWAAGLVVALRRQRRPLAPSSGSHYADETPQPPGAQPLALAAERGLAEMGDLSREPREAIIACYAAMEDALVDAGAQPQDSDTPSEVLARAVEHHAIHSDRATELVELFAEARFSPHVMTEEHRETALRALELVLDELRSPV